MDDNRNSVLEARWLLAVPRISACWCPSRRNSSRSRRKSKPNSLAVPYVMSQE